MKALQQAFKLIGNFESRSPKSQRAAIAKLAKLLSISEPKSDKARLAIRETDELRRIRAYMLITSGRSAEGFKQMESIVAHYESAIRELQEEAAFQNAEAALAAFKLGRVQDGKAYARSALRYAGSAQSVSRTLLAALEIVQRQQENASRRGKVRG